MKIEGTGLEGKEAVLAELDYAMGEIGFLRWAWDYKRATYDYRYHDQKTGHNIYLRIPSVVIEGEIEDGDKDSILRLEQPYIGRHIYPHGFDYEFDFPAHILNNAKNKLKDLNDLLEKGQ